MLTGCCSRWTWCLWSSWSGLHPPALGCGGILPVEWLVVPSLLCWSAWAECVRKVSLHFMETSVSAPGLIDPVRSPRLPSSRRLVLPGRSNVHGWRIHFTDDAPLRAGHLNNFWMIMQYLNTNEFGVIVRWENGCWINTRTQNNTWWTCQKCDGKQGLLFRVLSLVSRSHSNHPILHYHCDMIVEFRLGLDELKEKWQRVKIPSIFTSGIHN